MKAKLGIIFVVAIMTLAGFGAAYAHWTDEISINATVNTGSVKWHFTGESGTWAYKYLPDDTLVVCDSAKHANDNDYLLVGSAYGDWGSDDHNAVMTFENIFPLGPNDCWHADLVIEYTGTVPGKVNSITKNDAGTNWWDENSDVPGTGTGPGTVDYMTTDIIYVRDETGQEICGSPFDMDTILGVQLHQGYTVKFVLEICVPNDNSYQNLGPVTFDVDVDIVNWNEYPI